MYFLFMYAFTVSQLNEKHMQKDSFELFVFDNWMNSFLSGVDN